MDENEKDSFYINTVIDNIHSWLPAIKKAFNANNLYWSNIFDIPALIIELYTKNGICMTYGYYVSELNINLIIKENRIWN